MTMTLENMEEKNGESCTCKNNLKNMLTLDGWNKLSKEAMGREATKLFICLHFGIISFTLKELVFEDDPTLNSLRVGESRIYKQIITSI